MKEIRIGDVIRVRSMTAIYATKNGDVELIDKVTPIKGHRLVILVLGVEGPGEKVYPEAVLNTIGWKFEDETQAQPKPGQEGLCHEPAEPAKPVCVWTQDWEGNWEAACGLLCWGDKDISGTNFCPTCGNPVSATPYTEEKEPTDADK